jgi:hypothetical protein
MKHTLEAFFGLPFSWRQKRLTRSRVSLTEPEFVQSITEQGGDDAAASSLWKRLNEAKHVAEFTPYPSDDLGVVFGIAEEERDQDLILDMLNELGIRIPTAAQLSAFGPVDTPLRVAQLVASCRRSAADGRTRP